ncbi:sterol desaturase family protein [Pedobacter gandavensis]|nr:sterol desaturase family protein [Pedobacter gandavensis]WGQ12550.1 sterol desaturase family protein [Pedobacter gandavensis]
MHCLQCVLIHRVYRGRCSCSETKEAAIRLLLSEKEWFLTTKYKRLERWFIGTTAFHNQHHLNERQNFGFYTSIRDRLFGTYKH